MVIFYGKNTQSWFKRGGIKILSKDFMSILSAKYNFRLIWPM